MPSRSLSRRFSFKSESEGGQIVNGKTLWICGALMMALVAAAPKIASAMPAPTSSNLQIQDVFVDIPAQTILIWGQNFNNGSPLDVQLANIGDISDYCTLDASVTPQTITCNLSAGTPALPVAGDYLLTVATKPAYCGSRPWNIGTYSNFSGHYDQWDLTIGAVGPQGPAGPQGPPGVSGLAGQQCPSGDNVTGFDSTGNIICSSGPPTSPCVTTVFTFNTTSSQGGAFTQAAWTDGTSTQSQTGQAGCSITVNQPSGAVDLVGGTVGATPWSVNSFTGYSACSLTTVSSPDCSGLSLSISEPVQQNYPTCTSGLCDALTCSTGVATAQATVTCNP